MTWRASLCKHVWMRSGPLMILGALGVLVYELRMSVWQYWRRVGQLRTWQRGQETVELAAILWLFSVVLWAAWYTLMPGLTEFARVAVCPPSWCH